MSEGSSIIDIAEAGKRRRGRPKKEQPTTPATAALQAQEQDGAVVTDAASGVPVDLDGSAVGPEPVDPDREAAEAGVAPFPAEEDPLDVLGDELEASAAAGIPGLTATDAEPPVTASDGSGGYQEVPLADQGEDHQLDLSDLIAADVLASREVRPVALTAIEPEANPAPDAHLARSVKRQGVRVPVLLANNGPGRYGVVDGSRRIAAARKAGLLEVPAIHIPLLISDPRAQALRVALNRIRSENAPAEARSVWEMMRDGADETAIADATEMPVAAVRRRQEMWGRLLPGLRDAFALGRFAANVAEKASTLPHDTQQKLLEILVKEGRLTLKDVKHFIEGEDAAKQVSFMAREKDPKRKAEEAAAEGAKFARLAGWERSEWMSACMAAYDEAADDVPLGGE